MQELQNIWSNPTAEIKGLHGPKILSLYLDLSEAKWAKLLHILELKKLFSPIKWYDLRDI